MMRAQGSFFSVLTKCYIRLDCTQHHASVPTCIGLASKYGYFGVIRLFCAAGGFCLAATLRNSVTGVWLSGLSFPLEYQYLLDTAMSDEWQ